MITVIVILSVILVVSVFININLLRKIEKVDDELTDISMNMEEFIVNIKTAQSKIKEIDSKGVFESDDEVGTVFEMIKDTITNINIKYDIEKINEE